MFLLGAILNPGSRMRTTQILLSLNGCFKATFQGDGNFVVYNIAQQKGIWASGSTSKTIFDLTIWGLIITFCKCHYLYRGAIMNMITLISRLPMQTKISKVAHDWRSSWISAV